MRTHWLSLLLLIVGCGTAAQPQSASVPGPPVQPTARAIAPIPPGTPTPPAAAAALQNPNQAANDDIAAAVVATIAGRENEPAEKVFKNIQSLKGMPAERFVRVMNLGYSRALGVACRHCHVTWDYSSDEKREKRAAREMMAMNKMINEKLRSLENLEGKPEAHFVSCSTCHRGHTDPNEGLQ